MTQRTTRVKVWATLLAVALIGAMALAPAADAKKKGKKIKKVNVTNTVTAPVPDRDPGPDTPFGVLTSTIDAGKEFKGLEIRDVNVTVQTTGVDEGASEDLTAKLTAPNGAHTTLFSFLFGADTATSTSIGPLTLDDEAPLDLGRGPADNPTDLFTPWVGAAAPDGNPLNVMDNGPVTGTWTLTVLDTGAGNTSVLNSWTLNVVTGRPFLTK
jgi:subtilisin-like proprotein convertase family protein